MIIRFQSGFDLGPQATLAVYGKLSEPFNLSQLQDRRLVMCASQMGRKTITNHQSDYVEACKHALCRISAW